MLWSAIREARPDVSGIAMVGILEGFVLGCFSFALCTLLEMFWTASGVNTKRKRNVNPQPLIIDKCYLS